MLPLPQSGGFTRKMLRSPVWGDSLKRVGSAMTGERLGSGEAEAVGMDAAPEILSTADAAVLAALGSSADAEEADVFKLIAGTVELLETVAAAWADHGHWRDRREVLFGLLARRLSAHERALLEGELTYAISAQEAEQPGGNLRVLAARLSSGGGFSNDHLVTLQETALALAAMQVRAAGNMATSRRAGEAPARRADQVDDLVHGIVAKVSTTAKEGLRRAPDDHDVVALHVGTGLRLVASRPTLGGFDSRPIGEASSAAFLCRARDAWLELARLEHVVVSALDRELQTPTYEERFGGLEAAIADGAANVLYGARLVSRPESFRQVKAWSAQAIGLSYGLEAYIRGLRGVADGFGQAQLMVLTRLVRAVVAIVALDLCRAASVPSNGRAKPEATDHQ